MKFRSLHLLLLLAICPFVWLQSNQSKPQLYGYKKQNVYEKHPKLAEYFKNSPAKEPILPIPIDRRWVPKDERSKRDIKKEKSDEQVHETVMVYMVGGPGTYQVLQYAYAALSLLVSLIVLGITGAGINKSVTVVMMKNVYDRNSPPRELPVILSWIMSSKKENKTPIDTTRPKTLFELQKYATFEPNYRIKEVQQDTK